MQARRRDPSERVAALVVGHQEALLRVARQVSLCSDDAHDAVQRALEIYLRRLDRVEEATEVAWLKVVVRNEALAVRKARATAVGSAELEYQPSPAREPDECAASAERIARSTEALRRLKRDEARALIAKSMGLSYAEIAERFGWTATKVNRCLTEGRARFLHVYGEIETGEECRRLAPALLDLAEGRADSEAIVDLRPHLRACSSCRATVRHLHGTRRQRAVAALVLPGKWVWERFAQAKAEAYGAAMRVSELTAAAPLGGGRGAAATALVGLCLGGACATTLDDDKQRRPQPERRQASVEPGADRPAATGVARPVVDVAVAEAAAGHEVARPTAPRRTDPPRRHVSRPREFVRSGERPAAEFDPSAPPPEFAAPSSAPERSAPSEFAPAPPPAEFADAAPSEPAHAAEFGD